MSFPPKLRHGGVADKQGNSQQSGILTPRGRKLVLQYSNGSPCGKDKEKDKKRRDILGSVHDGAENKYHDFSDEDDDYMTYKDDDDDDDKKKKDDKKKETAGRRKSATISFLCDHDPEISTTASFVSADPDECAYFFEVRSQHACATAEPHKPGSVGPGTVFTIIFVIAVLVYIVGGIFYQRTVAHARGWRQLPNYSLWAGIWTFISVSLCCCCYCCFCSECDATGDEESCDESYDESLSDRAGPIIIFDVHG